MNTTYTYDKDTGILKNRKSGKSIGKGTTYQGKYYTKITMIWLLEYNRRPNSQVIKLDGDPTNFKLNNLEESSKIKNLDLETNIKRFLHYEPLTGKFHWKLVTNIATKVGTEAGAVRGTLPDDGYKYITIFGKVISAHRLAWYFCTGYFPKSDIDHKNHNRLDNRISNLQETTSNCRNKSIYSNNKTGYSGVYKKGNKYAAQINGKERFKYLGTYNTAKEAYKAKQAAEITYNYHKNHGL